MKLSKSKIIKDPAFWSLLGINVYLVYKYEQTPQIFTTLIWLYFSQNLLYGFFNYLDMITSKKIIPEPALDTDGTKKVEVITGSYAGGFLIFFGFFHFVYFIFLATMKKTGPFDWDFYEKFLLIFLVFQVFSFIQHKIQNKQRPVNLSRMASVPFLRVVPMHLCILIPAFINVSNLTIFLVLKVIADVVMYLVTTDYYRKGDSTVTLTALNINSISPE